MFPFLLFFPKAQIKIISTVLRGKTRYLMTVNKM